MKVVFLNNLFGRTAKGGAEVVVLNEARRRMVAGDEVVVVTLAPDDKLEEYFYEGVRVLAVPVVGHPFAYHQLVKRGVWHKLYWHAHEVHVHTMAWHVVGVVLKLKPDLLVTHNLMGFGLLVPRLLARAEVRHEHVCHDVQLLWPSGLLPATVWPWWMRLGVWLRTLVVRRIFGSPKLVRFPSRFLRDLHVEYGFFKQSEMVVVRNEVRVGGGVEKERSKERKDGAAFVFVGQVEKHKGILFLLRVWRRLGAAAPALRVIGDGAAMAEARRLAEGLPVVFLGRLGEERFAEMGAARAVIIPSLCIENQPTVIAEAHAAGVPVIAAKAGGIPEFVELDKGDRLFEAGDEAELLVLIRSFVK